MNAILSSNAKRSELVAALTNLITELPVQVPNGTFIVNGKQLTTADVVAQATALLAAMKATDVVRKQEADATSAEKTLRTEMKASAASVQKFVFGTLGETSVQAAALNFEPKKRATTTVATMAGALEKRAATREARHTMSKKQKAAIHGTVPAATAPEPAASPAPSATVVPASTTTK